jgi:hypothetical protein
MFGFLKDISFQKLFLKKKRNSRKKKNEKEKTSYLMLGRGPVSNPGLARVCGNRIGADQLSG